jgi:hypothetical protein
VYCCIIEIDDLLGITLFRSALRFVDSKTKLKRCFEKAPARAGNHLSRTDPLSYARTPPREGDGWGMNKHSVVPGVLRGVSKKVDAT